MTILDKHTSLVKGIRRSVRVALTAVFIAVLGGGVAYGFFSYHDASNGHVAQATAGSVGVSTAPTFSVSGRDVVVSWGGAANATSHTLQRSNVSPQSLATTLNGTCAGVQAATSCRDAGLPLNGASSSKWTYSVTGNRAAWVGAAGPASAQVSIPAPTLSLGATTFTANGGTTSGTVANFFDNEGITYCLDQSSSCSAGNTLAIDTVPATGGTKTTATLTIPSGRSLGTHTIYAIGSQGSTPSVAISITPGAASKLVFNPSAPGPGTAGTAIANVSVSVLDAFDNLVTAQNSGTVTLTIKSGSPQAAFTSGTTSKAVVGGTATFTNLIVTTAGSYTLAATPSSISGVTTAVDSLGFVVSASSANKLVFTTAPSTSQVASATATSGPFAVQVQDQFGNSVTNTGTAVTLSLSTTSTGSSGNAPFFTPTSGGASASSVTIATGSSTSSNFFYSDTKAGGPTVTGTATVNGQPIAGSSTVSIVAASASKLVFTSTPVVGPLSTTANLGPITVEREDAFGNPTTAGPLVVNLSSPAPSKVFAASLNGTSITSVTIANNSSSANFYFGSNAAGSPAVTASGSGVTSATQTETVGANKLVITSSPLSGGARSTATLGPITVELQNVAGTPITTGAVVSLTSTTSGTGVFASTSGGTTVTQVTINPGASATTVFYGDTKAGTPTITVAGTGLTPGAQQETITGGAPATLFFTSCSVSPVVAQTVTCPTTTPLNAVVTLKKANSGGGSWTASVSLLDAFGNPTTNTTGTAIAVSVTKTTNPPTVATLTFSAGTSLTIPINASQSSNSFTYSNAGVANGSGNDTVSATSVGLTSVTGSISW